MDPEIKATSSDTAAMRHDYQAGTGAGAKSLRLREELSSLKGDVDALMSHASTLSEIELGEARDRILSRFSSMRYAAKGMAEQASRQLSQGREFTVQFVRDKPLQSLVVAAGIGLLLGALLRRD